MTKFEATTKASAEKAKTRAPQPRSFRNLFNPPVPINTEQNIPGGQINLLRTPKIPEGLEVEIPAFTTVGPPGTIDTVTVYINERPVHSVELPVPHVITFPIPVTLQDPVLESHGEKVVYFDVVNSINPNDGVSQNLTVTVDRLDPNLGAFPTAIILPEDLPDATVTPEYLEAHDDELVLQIPDYLDPQVGDYWAILFGDEQSQPNKGGLVSERPINVVLTKDELLLAGPGTKQVTYILEDRAGNPTKLAYRQQVFVILEPTPIDLLAPRVDAAPIDIVEAREGVLIEVDEYTNAASGDEVRVYWNDIYVDRVFLPPTPNWPLPFTAPWAVISSGVEGTAHMAQVRYEVIRSKAYPSPVLDVEVDLELIGPPNPGEPDPVNPALDVPLLTSSTGELNLLRPEDAGQPADVSFTLYDPAQTGEVIRLYYGPENLLVATYTVQSTDNPGDPIELQISWDDIVKVGNGTDIPLFYKIFANATTTNFQSSGSQLVDVRAIPLAEVNAPELNLLETQAGISCSDFPWRGVNARVVDAQNLQVGDIVTLHWLGLEGFTNSQPVEETRSSFPREVLNQNEVDTGVNLTIPWIPCMEPLRSGFVELYWIQERGGEDIGRSPVKSYYYFGEQGTGLCPGRP
ncbi:MULTISPECIES: hypothetical protein [unclassified Pseudomonas]|uniref:hypothetical protein n=1 Tax=unclassified Pseudomonas TaxID=196821 RepID=UPI0008922219|nr:MULTISPECIES: hypothetical protein [unclassified Pseudomonas]UVL55326.1 hypothetical protein LOY22_21145 [Pseudomonas sp. B21-035]SDQ43523.1 hypothetical protein SAMN05216487_1797 [Pseudomonas sp. UC 17F4]